MEKDEFILEDRITSVLAMLQSITNRLLQIAFKRQLSDNVKQELIAILKTCINHLERL